MRVWSHSRIDGNGQEYIVIEVEEYNLEAIGESRPAGNNMSLSDLAPHGGMYVSFEVNHKQQQTAANWMHFYFGAPQIGGRIKIWHEILTEKECLEFCEKNYNGRIFEK